LTAPPEPTGRRRSPVLLFGWLCLLGLLAAAVGYLLTTPKPATPDVVGARFVVPAAEPSPTVEPPEDIAGTGDVGLEELGLAAEIAAVSGDTETPPWQRFAATAIAVDDRPRIAVVLTGLGQSRTATEAAITQLPAGVTLSFTPYAQGLEEWVALARQYGHEVMLDLPMEPATYPGDDPGPQALLTTLAPDQNLERLHWILARAEGYVGLAAVMGSRFTASEPHLKPILQELKYGGLLYLDNQATDDSVAGALSRSLQLTHVVSDRPLDSSQMSRVAVDARLVQVERDALTKGFAVTMGRPLPVIIERLHAWASNLEGRGLALAPITAVVRPVGTQ
jgi:polysaccharide deacetylase 2 family uncharacterized protein YibQ